MPKAINPMPNIDAVEKLNHSFDFTNALPDGVTIVSATVTLTVVSGTDTNPGGKINGSPQISGALVIISLGPYPNVVTGNVVTYQRDCQVVLSDGQTPNLYAIFTVQP